MSFFDIFKKEDKHIEEKPKERIEKKKKKSEDQSPPDLDKKKVEKSAPVKTKKKEAKKEAKKETKQEKKEVKKPKPARAIKSTVAWKVLERPHITEKASDLTKENKYMFRIYNQSNKIEVKQAVQDVYKVNVKNVRIINVPRKKRRLGKTSGWRKGYKKAIVTIQKGQEIEILPR